VSARCENLVLAVALTTDKRSLPTRRNTYGVRFECIHQCPAGVSVFLWNTPFQRGCESYESRDADYSCWSWVFRYRYEPTALATSAKRTDSLTNKLSPLCRIPLTVLTEAVSGTPSLGDNHGWESFLPSSRQGTQIEALPFSRTL